MSICTKFYVKYIDNRVFIYILEINKIKLNQFVIKFLQLQIYEQIFTNSFKFYYQFKFSLADLNFLFTALIVINSLKCYSSFNLNYTYCDIFLLLFQVKESSYKRNFKVMPFFETLTIKYNTHANYHEFEI